MKNRQFGFGAGGIFLGILITILGFGLIGMAYDHGRGLIGQISIWVSESKGIPKIRYSPSLSGKVDFSCKNDMIAWMGEIPKVGHVDYGGFGGRHTGPINEDLPAATLMQRSGKVTCSMRNNSAETIAHGAFGIFFSRDGENVSKRPNHFYPILQLAPGEEDKVSLDLKEFENIALVYVGTNPFKSEFEHSDYLWKIALTQCGKYPNGGTLSQRRQHDKCSAPLWKAREEYNNAANGKLETARNESIPISSIQ